ncbi:hypothetical protein NDA11_003080 [Ustilago hordei]|nr:hypothetical protein NDA10_000418 [Ustilago hordei]KAJ1573397.1 hypothetical protein NDA15_007338 [Ustilago hordei]KAJ1576634.1 hypothetical protein NDA11_003080 [Ustilago hordei]UTT88857.1 hypothetical protein NDA17_005406 [Ustilago hordei]
MYTAHAWANCERREVGGGKFWRRRRRRQAPHRQPHPTVINTSVTANTAPTRLDEQADTISQLAVSISELHHLVLALRHDLCTSNPPPTTVPSSSPPAPAPPTAPTPTAALALR